MKHQSEQIEIDAMLKLFPEDIAIQVVVNDDVPRVNGRPISEHEFFEIASTEKLAIAAAVRSVKKLIRNKARVKTLFLRPMLVTERADKQFTCFISAAVVLKLPQVDFSKALLALKTGETVRRAGWNGANQHVYMDVFDRDGEYLEPCFVLHNAQGKRQPGWVPSMGDMLALDWEVLTNA